MVSEPRERDLPLVLPLEGAEVEMERVRGEDVHDAFRPLDQGVRPGVVQVLVHAERERVDGVVDAVEVEVVEDAAGEGVLLDERERGTADGFRDALYLLWYL